MKGMFSIKQALGVKDRSAIKGVRAFLQEGGLAIETGNPIALKTVIYFDGHAVSFMTSQTVSATLIEQHLQSMQQQLRYLRRDANALRRLLQYGGALSGFAVFAHIFLQSGEMADLIKGLITGSSVSLGLHLLLRVLKPQILHQLTRMSFS